MLEIIAQIIQKPELKTKLMDLYKNPMFIVMEILYFSFLCIICFRFGFIYACQGGSHFLSTFFVLVIFVTILKIILLLKKQILTVYPSLLTYLLLPNHDQNLMLHVFFTNPLLYFMLHRTIKSSTEFMEITYINGHLTVFLLFVLPVGCEIIIFTFVIIVFIFADVVYDKIKITKEMQKQFEADMVDCLICKCEFEENEVLTILKCNHRFHEDCITTWFKFNNACPLCKQTLLCQGSVREIVTKFKYC
ncbi:hypothetical protein NUSPORA_01335 [Nucleospora cyclopteri]